MTQTVALCRLRNLPPGKRQDGFHPMPPEGRYDIVSLAQIENIETEVVQFTFDTGSLVNGGSSSYFVRTNEKWGEYPLYREAKFEKGSL